MGEEKKAVNFQKKDKGLVEFLGGPFFNNFFLSFYYVLFYSDNWNSISGFS